MDNELISKIMLAYDKLWLLVAGCTNPDDHNDLYELLDILEAYLMNL